jgi:hypothetical protein
MIRSFSTASVRLRNNALSGKFGWGFRHLVPTARSRTRNRFRGNSPLVAARACPVQAVDDPAFGVRVPEVGVAAHREEELTPARTVAAMISAFVRVVGRVHTDVTFKAMASRLESRRRHASKPFHLVSHFHGLRLVLQKLRPCGHRPNEHVH